MKKLIAIILSIISICSIFVFNVNAASSGSCGTKITYTLSDEGILTITGTGDINSSAFKNNQDIKKVIINEGVSLIGECAFSNCMNMTDISMPASLTTINAKAFQSCGLKTIDIPDTVKYINEYAFYSCKDVTKLTVGKKVERVGDGAFYDCYNLTEIYWNAEYCSMSSNVFYSAGYYNNGLKAVFGNTVTSVPDNIFNISDGISYSLINSVTFGNSVSRIGNYAFHNCKNLKNVTFPESLTSIGEAAFRYSGLTSVTIPGNVTNIGVGAFEECSDLASVNLTKNSRNTGQNIGAWAFGFNTSLTNITIPDTVTILGEFAFSGCSNLYNVVLGKNISMVGMGTFYYIPRNATVIYPACMNRFKQISGGELLLQEMERNYITISFSPCNGTSKNYYYADKGQHSVLMFCDMCGDMSTYPEKCTLNSEGICKYCNGGLLKQDVNIKIGFKKYNAHINQLPEYEKVENVPKGLKVTGYWYKDSDNKRHNINEQEILAKEVNKYYAKCEIDREVFILISVFNYIFYAIANFFNLIFG